MYFLDKALINKNLKVALIGAGGTGSYFAIELVKIATAMNHLSVDSDLTVTVFDGGVVTEANCIRQNFFKPQIGMNKADAVTWITNNLHGMNFKSVPRHVKPYELKDYDIIITCVDVPSIRHQIHEYFKTNRQRNNPLWLDTGNSRKDGQIVLGQLGSKKYLPNICDLYDYSELSDDDGLKKSCSAIESLSKQALGVNSFSARIGAQLLSNLLMNGKLEVHGAYFDCEKLTSEPIEISLETWSIYGYTPTATSNANL